MLRFQIEPALETSLLLLTDSVVTIGRSPLCHVTVPDPSASRVHCRVIIEDGRATLYDAGSRWGTFVNGHRVTTGRQLFPDDQIRIGRTSLKLIECRDTPESQ
ncbi:MAG: FHA domain-containing protein [Planctomycetaceae bacterium]